LISLGFFSHGGQAHILDPLALVEFKLVTPTWILLRYSQISSDFFVRKHGTFYYFYPEASLVPIDPALSLHAD
jgi:hypothetical protein